ncbi:MAG: chemotaxis protein CheE [Caulobacter sp.]
MTAARKFKVRNRLSAAMFDGGGKLVGQAIADAQAELSVLSPAREATICETVAAISKTWGPGAANRDATGPMDLYVLVLTIIDVSDSSALRGLPEACNSFCDLLDHCTEVGAWDWPAVDVHIATIQCLSIDTTLSEADRMKLVSGLARLMNHRNQASETP